MSSWILAARVSREAAGARAERDRANEERDRANEERGRADDEKQIAEAVRNFLQEKLLSQFDTRSQANALLAAGRSTNEVELNPRIGVLLDRAAAELTPDKIDSRLPNWVVQAELLENRRRVYVFPSRLHER